MAKKDTRSTATEVKRFLSECSVDPRGNGAVSVIAASQPNYPVMRAFEELSEMKDAVPSTKDEADYYSKQLQTVISLLALAGTAMRSKFR